MIIQAGVDESFIESDFWKEVVVPKIIFSKNTFHDGFSL
jgi:hypothetical protein